MRHGRQGILLGALAATALWSTAALARDDAPAADTQVKQDTSQQSSDSWREASVPDQNTGVGGSGDESTPPATAPGSVTVEQPGQKVTVQPQPGTDVNVQTGTPIAEPTVPPPAPAQPAYLTPEPTPVVVKEESNSAKHLRGVEVSANAGVEGYTGSLAPRIEPGVTYGAALGLRPTKVFGVELGYSGAVNEVAGNATSGADIVRNGGSAAMTLGLTASPVQPYLLAGVGVNSYQVRGATTEHGFRNDVNGDIPLGGGIRTQVGAFTADARFGYHVPFDDQFAEGVAHRDFVGLPSEAAGRYQATVNLGSTF